jgi:hypothetical protein
MEQDIMASENPSVPRPAAGRKQGNDFHPATPPSQQNSPSPFNDGQELIRGNHC